VGREKKRERFPVPHEENGSKTLVSYSFIAVLKPAKLTLCAG
jgi:hypothetical protein